MGDKSAELHDHENAASQTQSSSHSAVEPLGEWHWPAFCLNPRHMVEVLVEDGLHPEGTWVTATPCERVVDDHGHDTHIRARYRWQGDKFEEDFGPDHVRLCGAKVTVYQQLLRQQIPRLASTDAAW